MERNKHLKNQVLYITNPAYDALHSENLLEENDNNTTQHEQMFQSEVDQE